MAIKFKRGATETTFYKVDTVTGSKQSFLSISKPGTAGFGLNKEMTAWIADGNTIELQYTEEELEKKKKDDLKAALESQKQTCIQILKELDHKFLPNYRYPDDVPRWQVYQDKIFAILGSSEVIEFPEKPAFN